MTNNKGDIEPSKAQLTCPETGNILTVGFSEITPAQAIALLGKNHENNRTLKNGAIASYSQQMLAGEWHPASAEAIKLSANGILIDGQNRLHAVIKADIPVWFLVVQGVPEQAFSAIDDGVSRSFSDCLEINGVRIKGGAQRASAAIKRLMEIKVSIDMGTKLSSRTKTLYSQGNTQLKNFHAKLPNFNTRMEHFASQYNISAVQRNFNTPATIAMYYLFTGINEETDKAVLTICQSLETGTPFDGLLNKSPCYHILNRVRSYREKGMWLRSPDYIAMFIWALKWTLRGEPVDRLDESIDDGLDMKIEAVRIARERMSAI